MSENLKKAFMRGVCALNFEAMNVLQGSQQNSEEGAKTMTNGISNTISNMGNKIIP